MLRRRVINGRVRVAAEDYLDAAGAQYVARTPVTAYLRLSESIDLHRVDPTAILPPTVVVAVEGDRLVPLADLVGLVELGPRGSLRAALALWPRCLPQNRSHRCDPRLPHFWRVRMSLHANEPSCVVPLPPSVSIDRDTAHGAVTPPIVLSSNFSFEGFGNKRQYDYTRSGSRPATCWVKRWPNWVRRGIITTTGMGAINLVLNALLQPGDTLVVPRCLRRQLAAVQRVGKEGALRTGHRRPDRSASLAQALATQPKLVLVETPSNPLRITDLRFVIDAAHKAGALVVVDNTFCHRRCSSRWCGPGAAFHHQVHQCHSDVVGGAVVARDPALHEQLVWWGNALGLTGSPFDAFLTLRGLRTLDAPARAPGKHGVDRCPAGPASGGRRGVLPGRSPATPSPRASRMASARCCHSNWRTAPVMIRMRRCVHLWTGYAVSPWPNRWAASKA